MARLTSREKINRLRMQIDVLVRSDDTLGYQTIMALARSSSELKKALDWDTHYRIPVHYTTEEEAQP